MIKTKKNNQTKNTKIDYKKSSIIYIKVQNFKYYLSKDIQNA